MSSKFTDIDLDTLPITDMVPTKAELALPRLLRQESEGVTMLRLVCINRSVYRQQAIVLLPSGHRLRVGKNETFTHLYEVEDGPYTPKEVRGKFQSCTSLLTVLAKASVEGRLPLNKEAMV